MPNLQKQLKAFELSMEEMEEGLECLFRRLLKNRVTLLNFLNHQTTSSGSSPMAFNFFQGNCVWVYPTIFFSYVNDNMLYVNAVASPHGGQIYSYNKNLWATRFSCFFQYVCSLSKVDVFACQAYQQFITIHLFYLIHIFFLFMGYPFQLKLLGKPETTKFLLLIFLSLFDKLFDRAKLQVALFRVAAVEATIFVSL